MPHKIQYAAQLAHVQEVSLRGRADLAYWTDRLRGENLVPVAEQGRAQILVIAANLKYMGVRFTEISFSVFAERVVASAAEARGPGSFLVCAFNSARFFAFCERVLFKTPYYYGDARVSVEQPIEVELLLGGRVVYRAAMQQPLGEPAMTGPGGWDGPVYLPGRERLFFATIAGHTLTYPWEGGDSLLLAPTASSEVLLALVDSQFEPCEWSLRRDASHAKSKTYRRNLWHA